MKNWIVLAVAAFLFFSGCQKEEPILPLDEMIPMSSSQKGATIGEEIYLKIDESVVIKPDGFVITFKEVPEDSRCPIDANCIWEGRATIRLIVENREFTHDVVLETPNTHQTTGPAINLFGRTIKLLQVAPYPTADHPITAREYRIVLLVDEWEGVGSDR